MRSVVIDPKLVVAESQQAKYIRMYHKKADGVQYLPLHSSLSVKTALREFDQPCSFRAYRTIGSLDSLFE